MEHISTTTLQKKAERSSAIERLSGILQNEGGLAAYHQDTTFDGMHFGTRRGHIRNLHSFGKFDMKGFL